MDTRPRKQKIKVDVQHAYKKHDFLRDTGTAPTTIKVKRHEKRHVESVTRTTKQKEDDFKWSKDKASRRQRTEQPHGYNLITWKKSHEPKQGHKFSVASRRGAGATRPCDSSSRTLKKDRQSNIRFYCHVPENKKRQDLQRREGLKVGIKKSSILGIGRGEMSSEGVNDNFGNSLYNLK